MTDDEDILYLTAAEVEQLRVLLEGEPVVSEGLRRLIQRKPVWEYGEEF